MGAFMKVIPISHINNSLIQEILMCTHGFLLQFEARENELITGEIKTEFKYSKNSHNHL